MDWSIFTKAILLVGLSGGVIACSHAQAVCDLICECEHCNDQDEIVTCDQIVTAQDVADAYDCGDSYDTFLTCFEEKGTCDDKTADFSTSRDGTCEMNTCTGSGATCQNNGDCNGEDRCNDARDAYQKCIDAASDHSGVAGGF